VDRERRRGRRRRRRRRGRRNRRIRKGVEVVEEARGSASNRGFERTIL